MEVSVEETKHCVVAGCSAVAAVSAGGSGDVSGCGHRADLVVHQGIQNVVNNVVFPAVDMILAVVFFVKLSSAYFDYRKHGQFDFTAPAILFACLVFTLTAPLYIWKVLGI